MTPIGRRGAVANFKSGGQKNGAVARAVSGSKGFLRTSFLPRAPWVSQLVLWAILPALCGVAA